MTTATETMKTTNVTNVSPSTDNKSIHKGIVVMTTLLIVMVLGYFVLIASISARGSSVGEPICEMTRVMHVEKEGGLITTPSTRKFVQEFDIPEEGNYQFDIDYTAETPGYYSYIVIKNGEGEKALSFGSFWITGYRDKASLPEGKSTVEVYLINTEQELLDYNNEYHVFEGEDLDWALSNLDFDSFQEEGSWDANLTMKVSPIGSGTSSSGTMIFLATAVILSYISIACIWIYRCYGLNKKMNATGTMSLIGSYYTLFAIIVIAVQMGAMMLAPMLIHGLNPDTDINFQSLLIVLSVDLVGFPVLWWILRGVPAEKPAEEKVGVGKWICYLLMSAGLCGIGMVVGVIVHSVFTLPFGASNSSAVAELISGSNIWLRILVVGIGAPVFEELIFRKLLIDRVKKHGELLAILTSGLFFGLFHGNFSQFFYAFLLGCLFAYVYVRSGRIRYTILLHMAINMTSSVITSNLAAKYLTALPANMSDSQAMTEAMTGPGAVWIVLYLGWLLLLMVVALIGVVVMIVWFVKKKFYLQKTEDASAPNLRELLLNPSMLLFYAAGAGLFILQYLPAILTSFAS